MITDSSIKTRMDEFEKNQKKTLAILERLELAIKGDLGVIVLVTGKVGIVDLIKAAL